MGDAACTLLLGLTRLWPLGDRPLPEKLPLRAVITPLLLRRLACSWLQNLKGELFDAFKVFLIACAERKALLHGCGSDDGISGSNSV